MSDTETDKKTNKQECIPVGCVPSAAVAVCFGGGVYSPYGQTDTCENIIFPQLLLRTVMGLLNCLEVFILQ